MADIKQLLELMKADSDPADAAHAGVWYEPRSLWLTKSITLSEYTVNGGKGAIFPGANLRVQLPRNPFRNGSRFPFTINRFAISGVGYPLARPDAAAMQEASPGPADLNGTSWINTLQVSIASPYRQHFTQTVNAGLGFAPRPTGQPNTSNGKSSLFGLSTLRFDKPLVIPKAGTIEWDISSLQGMQFLPEAENLGTITTATNLPTDPVRAVLTYLERGGLLPGSARSREVSIATNQGPGSPVPNDQGYPYALPPAFGPISPAGVTVPFWDPRTRFDTKTFRDQNATRAGSTDLYGMTAAVDQLDYDEDLLTIFPGATVAPLSTRIGTRVRLVGGPANDWWWHPGAPMALVMDTITPASVYWLDEPITLMPGDSLDVSVDVRTGAPLNDGGIDYARAYAAAYQFGISFNGFAAISG